MDYPIIALWTYAVPPRILYLARVACYYSYSRPKGEFVPKSTRICNGCQVEFQADNREIRRGNAKYCSRSCASHYGVRPPRKGTVEVTCAHCGVLFKKRESHLANSRSGLFFCCREHKDLSQRLGGIKEIMPPHYGTGIPDYSYARADSCFTCGYDTYPEILVVHHKNLDRSDNSVDNLVCLCSRCHDEEHFMDRTGRFSGWK